MADSRASRGGRVWSRVSSAPHNASPTTRPMPTVKRSEREPLRIRGEGHSRCRGHSLRGRGGGRRRLLGTEHRLPARSFDGHSSASVVVAFDRTTPAPPPPTLTVAPNAGLPATATVAVHAAGLLSNGHVTVEQCTPAGVPSRCTGRTAVRADASRRSRRDAPGCAVSWWIPLDCATSLAFRASSR